MISVMEKLYVYFLITGGSEPEDARRCASMTLEIHVAINPDGSRQFNKLLFQLTF